MTSETEREEEGATLYIHVATKGGALRHSLSAFLSALSTLEDTESLCT